MGLGLVYVESEYNMSPVVLSRDRIVSEPNVSEMCLKLINELVCIHIGFRYNVNPTETHCA